MKPFYFIILLSLFITSCENKPENTPAKKEINNYSFEIQNLSDDEYPDNPDIGFRTNNYNYNYFESGIIYKTDSTYTIAFYSVNGDSILLNNINLKEYIPTIPSQLKKDKYISYLALVNQEWNRNQVRFNPNEFHSNNNNFVRIDLARNG